MWMVRRLKALGATRSRLIDGLQKQLLSVFNHGVIAWDSLLTEEEEQEFERVLKAGLKIIWGQDYTSFVEVLIDANLRTIRQVCCRIVNIFVKKSVKHDQFKKWFVNDDTPRVQTRAKNRTNFKPVPASQKGFIRSPPSLH